MFKQMMTTGMCVVLLSTGAAAVELTTNGGFEAGDTSGWTEFAVGGASTFNVTNDANTGSFAGRLNNVTEGTGYVIKQANLGVGLVSPGDTVDISFALKGSLGPGGVASIVLFSELDGGGVSATENIPFSVTTGYQTFTHSAIAGPDVSGGVTLQFVAITGALSGSTAELFIDDVSVSIVPEPTSLGLLGMGGLALLARRRK